MKIVTFKVREHPNFTGYSFDKDNNKDWSFYFETDGGNIFIPHADVASVLYQFATEKEAYEKAEEVLCDYDDGERVRTDPGDTAGNDVRLVVVVTTMMPFRTSWIRMEFAARSNTHSSVSVSTTAWNTMVR